MKQTLRKCCRARIFGNDSNKSKFDSGGNREKTIKVILSTIHSACFFSIAVKNVKIIIYETIILPVVAHGCKIWSLTLKEEHRLRVF
jgi:hypothetical protein